MHFRPDTTEWVYDRCIFEWSTVCPLSLMCREYYFDTGYAAIISNSQCSLLLRSAKSKGKGIAEPGKAGVLPILTKTGRLLACPDCARQCSSYFWHYKEFLVTSSKSFVFLSNFWPKYRFRTQIKHEKLNSFIGNFNLRWFLECLKTFWTQNLSLANVSQGKRSRNINEHKNTKKESWKAKFNVHFANL